MILRKYFLLAVLAMAAVLVATCGNNAEQCGTLPIFLSDVKARRDKMAGLVERMLNCASGCAFRLTSSG